ncbi:hypothetical protein GCM10027048_19700 [Hymenobacter coalescens]
MQRVLALVFTLALAARAGALAQAGHPSASSTITAAEPAAAESSPAAPPAPAVYHVAEVMPAFPGGAAAQQAFLRDKLRFPDEALRRGLSGKVLVQFVVDERGRIQDPQVVKGLGYGLDQEALRLVRIMPWWTPGLIGGQPVRVQCTLPIVFRALE